MNEIAAILNTAADRIRCRENLWCCPAIKQSIPSGYNGAFHEHPAMQLFSLLFGQGQPLHRIWFPDRLVYEPYDQRRYSALCQAAAIATEFEIGIGTDFDDSYTLTRLEYAVFRGADGREFTENETLFVHGLIRALKTIQVRNQPKFTIERIG